MLNNEFTTAYSSKCLKVKARKRPCTQDIITKIHKYLNDFVIPRKAIVFLIDINSLKFCIIFPTGWN
ncbi:hypothetical protein Glove_267g57 [Diversispora epigaea]|uniref:Uncharacterized protein n=1 Tax=Diversispora epigaea TaxID=1348612 RepID=A0A397I934_9GLOM|nr:hypothetical protein Glove_267g57 [Diversispora epigaea]